MASTFLLNHSENKHRQIRWIAFFSESCLSKYELRDQSSVFQLSLLSWLALIVWVIARHFRRELITSSLRGESVLIWVIRCMSCYLAQPKSTPKMRLHNARPNWTTCEAELPLFVPTSTMGCTPCTVARGTSITPRIGIALLPCSHKMTISLLLYILASSSLMCHLMQFLLILFIDRGEWKWCCVCFMQIVRWGDSFIMGFGAIEGSGNWSRARTL